MWTLSNIQEYTIQKEDVSFNVKMLTPGKTKIKEELAESLVLNGVNTNFIFAGIHLFNFGNSTWSSVFFSFIINFFDVFKLLDLISVCAFIVSVVLTCLSFSINIWSIIDTFF